MTSSQKLTLPAIIDRRELKNPDHPALTFIDKNPVTYRQFFENIHAVSAWLEKLGIQKGDKVAILSENMPHWGIVYFGITFMGAVVVPILPDFTSAEISNIISHSGSNILFVSKGLATKTKGLTDIDYVVNIEDFTFNRAPGNAPAFSNGKQPTHPFDVEEEDLAAIIYTSGTTGNSKGVMLMHKNISSNAMASARLQPINENDRFISILPLSHTLENTLGLVLPMMCGATVYYLQKPPTASVLLPALQKVKPTIMLTVPIIMEKIYKNKVLPQFTNSKLLRKLYNIPLFRKKLNRVAGKKLSKTFGGALRFYGIGGAKLDTAVEQFLIEAKFPYAIGYGLTETSPLLAGAVVGKTKLNSTGEAVDQVELRIVPQEEGHTEGEIWARGPNVMKGYYKEPELTAQVLTEDGWFKTGDLGEFDDNNYLFIKGRLKNMIVGSSGENIYPEEIENLINSFQFVSESLVLEKEGKLVAMVHFNQEELEKKYQAFKEELVQRIDEKIEELKKELHAYINAKVNKFSRIQMVLVQHEPFKKTATQKIKRYLYMQK